MNHWIAFVEPQQSWLSYSDSDKQKIADCGVVGVSIRAGRPGWLDAVKEARDLDLRVHIEAWAGEMDGKPGVNAADGERMGHQFAEWCDLSDCEAARVNAENEVWRDNLADDAHLNYANPAADEYLDALSTAFHGYDRWALQYLGFVNPANYYKGADRDHDGRQDNLVPEYVLDRYQGVDGAPSIWVMAYQSSEASLRKVLETAAKKCPNRRLGAYAAVGRFDTKSGGIIGTANGWTRIILEPYAVPLDAVTWYIGLNQSGDPSAMVNPRMMVLKGHAAHPALVDLIPRINELVAQKEGRKR